MQLGVPLGVGGECWTCDPRVSGSSPGDGNLKKSGLESSWLKSLGLKGLGLKLVVEKSGVEMNFNPPGVCLNTNSL